MFFEMRACMPGVTRTVRFLVGVYVTSSSVESQVSSHPKARKLGRAEQLQTQYKICGDECHLRSSTAPAIHARPPVLDCRRTTRKDISNVEPDGILMSILWRASRDKPGIAKKVRVLEH